MLVHRYALAAIFGLMTVALMLSVFTENINVARAAAFIGWANVAILVDYIIQREEE